MEPICDYLGNEIKHGMTIKVMRTKPIYGDIKMMKPKKNGKGYFKEKTIFKQPKQCWDCVMECLVEKGDDGKLRYIYDYGDSTVHFLLESIHWGFQKVDLLTIKGISDERPLNAL